MDRWYPIDVRGDKQKEEAYDALLDGVPGHLREFLTRFMRAVLRTEFDREIRGDYLMALEHNLRVTLDWTRENHSALDSFLELATQKPNTFLSAIDYALRNWSVDNRLVEKLDKGLRDGAFAWTVHRLDRDNFCLIRRMDKSVQEAIDITIAKSRRAGEYLLKALVAVYGRNPDASTGYRESVRAVEAAAIAVICPNKQKATLGDVIGILKADIKDAKRWKLALNVDTKVDPTDVLRSMCELLWTNHFDRHGTHDESVPLNVSPAQAEAAFHLAATLVHWFASGKVTQS